MMDVIFFAAAGVAIVSTVMVITRLNAIHALLYLITSLLAVAVIFFVLGAPFVAALEVIIYAGAIMVLFIFAAIMLNLGPDAVEAERRWFTPWMLVGPGIMGLLLFGLTLYVMVLPRAAGRTGEVSPQEVGIALYGPYLLGVELSALMLLAGLVGAYHLARREAE
jgi:NADH-quinone oxidoreductase subunit J